MATDLQTTAERVDKDRVKLRVEVPEDSLEPAITSVYRELSQTMKVPGFRKGKVPRRIIDSRVGPDFVRSEALKEALPDFYRTALQTESLEAISTPDIDIVEFTRGQPIVFEAVFDVRPEVVVPDLGAITIEAPPVEVTDDDLAEQLDRLRDRFAELETIGREARRGDFVLIDLKGYRHDELVEGASAPDYLYELGSGNGPPKLEAELLGAKPGVILKFNDTMPAGEGESAGEELSFSVLVKEIKAKKLPELNDDFAKTVGAFDDMEELKEDLGKRMKTVKRAMVEEEIRGRTLEQLVETSELEPPDSLVEGEFNHRLHHFEEDLTRAGLNMARYSQQAGSTELEVRKELRDGAARSVVAELLLEQVARDQDLKVEEDDLGREIAVAAAQTGRDPQDLAKELVEAGRLESVVADIMRRKALDYVVEHVNVVNRPVDEDADEGEEKQ
jgi:trigger factor